jgi:hypothetical protein
VVFAGGGARVPTVLITAETGIGKGLVTRMPHDSGPRVCGPFLEVSCAAVPDTMLEAELFGFEAGTFTDAVPALIVRVSAGSIRPTQSSPGPMRHWLTSQATAQARRPRTVTKSS